MKTKPIDDNFVCEIHELDCKSITTNEITTLLDLLFKYKVLVVKKQTIDVGHYKSFIEKLGKPIHHVLQNFALDAIPEIIKISNYIDESGEQFGVLDGGAYWHSDMSYTPDLGIATSLYSIQVPPDGGETHFINLVDGLNKLYTNKVLLHKIEEQCSAELDAIYVRHLFGNRRKLNDATSSEQPLSEMQEQMLQEVRHKLVERHPVTQEKTLFAISGTSFFIDQLSEQQSIKFLDTLEDYVFSHAQQYHHRYEQGDIVIWDNTTTLHSGHQIQPTSDFSQCRLLYRMNISYHSAQSSEPCDSLQETAYYV